MRAKIDYKKEIGKKYGRLTIKEIKTEVNKKAIAICDCECGNIKITQFTNLKIGKTKSCGCLNNELIHKKGRGVTHNMCNSRIYHIYQNIKQRCYNPNHVSYNNYGGRGIKVCDEWKNDFLSFYNWSIKNGYSEDNINNGRNMLSIDRIDNNKDYMPDNCRWVTIEIQNYNKRTNFFTLQDIKLINSKGFNKETIKQRMKKHDLSLNEALSIPLNIKNIQNYLKGIK